ncbi:uncharacterized protein B0T15DRAFT_488845 [Chaetomium strumarium]|uniref:Uncharacterized protein n=1 Tax=Chaetomium strumarium TaxID=1170767 RepID=A0AAJ0H264_9PEZI|nr:hypothetical protein B0T15DRAFT_488845 [Chaetomium strumarium]
MDPPLFRQRQRRGGELRHAIKITACGGMIGTAVLFPLANVQGLWFRAVTLSIFTLSALAFHALHIEPFIRFGPYTAAAALVFLLVAVLSAGSSRKDLIPWLPLFIASVSLITVATHEASQHIGHRPVAFDEEALSRASMDSIQGQCQPHWDALTQSHFPAHIPPEDNSQAEPHVRRASPAEERHRNPESDLDSDQESVESGHPLLGPQ